MLIRIWNSERGCFTKGHNKSWRVRVNRFFWGLLSGPLTLYAMAVSLGYML